MKSSLIPIKEGRKAAYKRITYLQKTVAGNPAQVKRLREVENVLREWQKTVAEPLIAVRREIGDG